MQKISRKEAKAFGLKRYCTCEPCPKGHYAERMVSNRLCCACLRDPLRKHATYVNNRDHYTQYNHRRYEADPGAYALRNKKWASLNREKLRAIKKKYVVNNPEKAAESRKKTRVKHPENVRVWQMNRRVRKLLAEGTHSGRDIRQLFLDQSGLCLCGTTLFDYHVDHKVPLSRGGSNWPGNLQLLCQPCNDKKGTKTMSEWRVAI